MYFELCPTIMDKKYVKKVKFNVVFNHVIQKFDVVLVAL
jgi:hypothetical protein